MKPTLPASLRAALLTAMAGTVCTAYAKAPFDPSITPGAPSGTIPGLLVGDENAIKYTIDSELSVSGDVVVGAGDRENVTGGDGTLNINANMHVSGNVCAGGSGANSFPGYVSGKSAGGEGWIKVDNGSELTVEGSILLGSFSENGHLKLNGTLSIENESTATTKNLILNEGSDIRISGNGYLNVTESTYINSSVSLADTGNRGGSLGRVSVNGNSELKLLGGNTMKNIFINNFAKATVSGSNQLGGITISDEGRLLIEGHNTAIELHTYSSTIIDINGTLSVEEIATLNGQTTVSGRLEISNQSVNSDYISNTIALLINGDTQSGQSMLSARDGFTGDFFHVSIDLGQGYTGLNGKTITFAANGENAVAFSKESANFRILAPGRISEQYEQGNRINIIQEIGSSTAYYSYSVISATPEAITNVNWTGTGIEWDKSYSTHYAGRGDDEGKRFIFETHQEDATIIKPGSDFSSGLVSLQPSGSWIVFKDLKVSNDLNNALSFSQQSIQLKQDGTSPLILCTGPMSWEVWRNTRIQGRGVEESQIGGLEGPGIQLEGAFSPIPPGRIGTLNIASGRQLTVLDTKVVIDRTLSMGQGAGIVASNAEIIIGDKSNPLEIDNLSYEVPRFNADGSLFSGADGNPVMDTVTLSGELDQKRIRHATFIFENSTFKFDQFTTLVNGKELNSGAEVFFDHACVSITQTEEGAMELGGGDVRLVFQDSRIGGTGTLNNIVMNGGHLRIGNSPGRLKLNGGSYNGVNLHFMIDPELTVAGAANTDSSVATGMLSQLNLADSASLSDVVLNVYMQTRNGLNDYVDIPNTSTGYLDRFTEGTSFEFITGLENLSAESSFTVGSLPTLMDGLSWNTDKLFTEGIIEVVRSGSSHADLGRIANTLVSAGKTVSGFGQMTRAQVYEARPGGSNIWARGLGTFLNHSSHNGRTGFDYNAGGYAVGADTLVEGGSVVGIGLGQSFGRHTPKEGYGNYDGGKVDMDSIMVGLYGAKSFEMKNGAGSMKLDAYASYGRVDNDSVRHSLTTGQAAKTGWKENAYAAGVTLSYMHQLCKCLHLSPFASLDYICSDMDSATESSENGDIRYEGSSYQNLSLSLGAGLSRAYLLKDGQQLTSYASLAYVGDLVRKDGKVTTRNLSGTFSEKSVSPGRNAFQLHVGLGWQITDQWGARAGYTAEWRRGASDQGVNIGVNYSF